METKDMTKEQIEQLYFNYLDMFGEFPPITLDSDFYSKDKIDAVRAAIATGRKLR